MEIVYSTRRGATHQGRRHHNPRYFSAIVPGVTKVWIIGDWPRVESAWRDAGVEISVLPTDAVRIPVEVPDPPQSVVDAAPSIGAPKRESLLQEAKDLDVSIDRRWGDARIKAEIDKVKF